jgi:poly(A) polymerase
MLYAADDEIQHCLAQLAGWQIPTFKLKGGDIIAMGLTAGPAVAKTLQSVETQWVAEGFPDNSRLNEIASQRVTEALSASRNA